MSWAINAFAAFKRIVLLEERISNFSCESKALMESCKDLDRRLVRLEAKFELMEHLSLRAGRAKPRRLPARKKK